MMSKKVMSGILLLTLIGSTAAWGESITCRVMAYNVGSAAHIPLGPRQIGQIADTIVDNAADVVGLCEVDVGTAWHDGRDHTAELLVALAERGWPMHIHRWPTIDALGGWMVNALLTRLPIRDMGYEQFHPPGQPAWQVGYVTLQVSPSTQVRAYMTHIWPPSQHPETIGQMGRWASEWDGPAVVMGDFNHGWQSEQARQFRDSGWRSSCEVVHAEVCPTVQGSAYVSGPLPLNGQIDYIYGNARIEFLDSYVGYYSMSDHWPIVAVVRVQAPEEPYPLPLPYDRDGADDSDATGSGDSDTSPRKIHSMRDLQRMAAALYRRHAYAEAAKAFSSLEKHGRDPDDSGFAAYSAACMHLLNGDDERARDGFHHVAASYSGSEWSARAHYQLAFVHRRAGRWEEAERAFTRYLGEYYDHIHPAPRSPAIKVLAGELSRMWREAGEEKPAQAFLDAWAEDPPTEMVARCLAYHRGQDLLKADQREQAYAAFRQALPLAPWMYRDDARRLAMLFLEQGDRAHADAFYAQYLRCTSDDRIRRVHKARWRNLTAPEEYMYTVRPIQDVRIDGRLDEYKDHLVQRLRHPEHTFYLDPYGTHEELRADLYLAADQAFLYVGVEVHDNVHDNAHRPEEMWRGDSLQIAVNPGSADSFSDHHFELGVALIENHVTQHVWMDRQERNFSEIRAAVTRDEAKTRYEVALPRDLLAAPGSTPVTALGLNIAVNNADGHGRTGWIDWTPGIAEQKRPELYPVIQFDSSAR